MIYIIVTGQHILLHDKLLVLMILFPFQSCTMVLTMAAILLPHLCAVMGAFTQTRPQATLADQDDYVKHPQQQPLDPEELKVSLWC